MLKKLNVFIINLPNDVDRYRHMKKICREYELNYMFINAVNGTDVSPDYFKKQYNSEQALKKIGRELTKGEIGCLLSHKKTYHHIIKKKIPCALILEDDVELSPNCFKTIETIIDSIDGWECIMLGYHQWGTKKKIYDISIWGQKKITKRNKLVRFTALVRGGYGYLLSLKGAEKLIYKLENRSIDRPIDEYIGGIHFLNLFGISPPCITISDKYPENETGLALERNKILNQPKIYSENSTGIKILYWLKKLTKIPKTILRITIRIWNIIKPPIFINKF